MTATVTRRGIATLLGATVLLAAVPAAAQDKNFALIQINQQALFFNQMNEGAQAAADAAGVELVIFNANNDPGRAEQRDRDLHPGRRRRHRHRRDRRERHHAGRRSGRRRGHPRRRHRRDPARHRAAAIAADRRGQRQGRAPTSAPCSSNVPTAAGGGQDRVVGALNSFIQNLRLDGFEGAI